MKKNILSYLIGLSLLCFGGQLLVSCDTWDLPTRKSQRDCVKPAGNLDMTAQLKQVTFTVNNNSGTIDQISWDFGNGNTTVTKGMTTMYTYPASGTYNVKATLTNSCGSETTLLRTIIVSDAVPPTVSLQAFGTASNTTATASMAVTSNGNAAIVRYGICYSSTNQTPTINDLTQEVSGNPATNTPLSFILKDLVPNTFYYVRSYAVNATGQMGYSSPVQTFRTGQNPAVTTSSATNVATATANVNFVVSSPGSPAATSYGICYSSTMSTPDITSSVVPVNSPTVAANTVVNLTNLAPNTTYYYRAFAKTASGEVVYGEIMSFTTQADAVTQDLIAYVPFTNQSTDDLSGNGNRVFLVNNPTFTTDRKGVANAAIQLNGASNYFYMNDNSTLRPEALSISIWIKPVSVNNVNNRVQIYNKSRWVEGSGEMYSSLIKINETGPGLTFMTDVKQNSNCQSGQGWQNSQFSSSFQLNTWHHLVFTYSGRSIRMYFDNILIDQRDNLPTSTMDNCPGGELKFGAQLRDYPNYFNGAMDDIRIYKRALTAAEVGTLFNQ